MEIDRDEATGQPTTNASIDEAKRLHDEISDPAYVQKLLASNPVFDNLLRDVKVVLLLTEPAAVHEDDLEGSAASAAAASAAAGNAEALKNSDLLEISLRSHAVLLLNQVLREAKAASSSAKDTAAADEIAHPPVSPALSELGEFWTSSVQLCRHVVQFASERHYDKHFSIPAVRKLAFVLLEDILDGLTLKDAQAFWTRWFAPMHPLLLKLDAGSPSSNLVFLKTLNAFWKRCCASSSNSDGGQWAATVLQTLASSFALGERSATRVWGSRNLDTLSDFDTSDQYQQRVASAPASAAASTEPADSPRVDYSVYQSLWSLQQDFASPYIKNVGVFLSRVKTVLEAMETATPQPLPPVSTSMSNRASVGKYLTHARLLPYQLQDPEFRAHVLTQFLIVAHHVSREAPGVGTQLEESRQRAVKLVSATHPQLLSALNYVLKISEPQWCAWKKNKFPDMDVKAARKRPRGEPHPAPPSSKIGRRQTDAAPPLLDLRKELPSICAPLQAPTLERHLVSHEYIDALDPDAGIEDEYHPKSNPYFCWQALRLLPVGDLDRVSFRTGDFEAAVRHIWKRDKGIDIPVAAAAAAPEKAVDDDDAAVDDAAADDAAAASDAEPFYSGTREVVLESQETTPVADSEEAVEDGHDSSMNKANEKVNGVDDALISTDAPMDATSTQENEDDADMEVVGEDSNGSVEELENRDESSERKAAASDAVADSRNGQAPVVAVGNRESSGPKTPPPSQTSITTVEVSDRGSGGPSSQALPSLPSRPRVEASSRAAREKSPPRREDPPTRTTGPGPDPRRTDGPRAEEGPPNRNPFGSFGDRPRHPSGSPPPPPHDSGRRGGSRDDIVVDHGREGSEGHAPRGGAGFGRGGGRGGSLPRDDRNGGSRARDGGGRGPPLPSRDDRGAPQRGRDDRGAPPPGRDDRGPPAGRDARAPPAGRDDRGPPPGRDDRGGPAPRREERVVPPPGVEGGPPQSSIAREDRAPHPSGRRDDRGPPPSATAGAGRDDRNGPNPQGGRRGGDDRWVRGGDRPQERREGSGGGGGRGQQGRRGVSRDGPRR
jgi:THO complex subunit 1